MKIPQDSTEGFNIALVGTWNPAIFSPQWVKANLSTDPTKEVVIAYPLMTTAMPPRVTVDGVNIFPSSQIMMVSCETYSDDAVEDCAEKVQNICTLLPHTPVSAAGINFRFNGRLDESAVITDLFTFADAGRIDSQKYFSGNSLIKRSFQLGNSDFLNLSIELISDNLKIEFNFHTESTSSTSLAKKITALLIAEKKAEALEFLTTVYGIDIEE